MSHQMPADFDVQLLEPLLRKFVDLVGLQTTMLIVDRWGGLPLYIARDPSQDGDLARLVGMPAASVLGAEFGGERPAIPKAGRALRAIRDRQICADHATKSLRQLVLEYKLSERRICEILAASAPESASLWD